MFRFLCLVGNGSSLFRAKSLRMVCCTCVALYSSFCRFTFCLMFSQAFFVVSAIQFSLGLPTLLDWGAIGSKLLGLKVTIFIGSVSSARITCPNSVHFRTLMISVSLWMLLQGPVRFLLISNYACLITSVSVLLRSMLVVSPGYVSARAFGTCPIVCLQIR